MQNRNEAASLARGEYLKYHDSDDVMYRHCLAVMVEALDAEPRAGFALSGSRDWPGGKCPMLLTPRLAYEREFLGTGLFHVGPACAMFRDGGVPAARRIPGIGRRLRLPVLDSTPARPRTSCSFPAICSTTACTPTRNTRIPRNGEHYARARARGLEEVELSRVPARSGGARPRQVAISSGRDPRCVPAVQGRGTRVCRRDRPLLGLDVVDWVRYLRPPQSRAPNAGTPAES